MDSYVIGTDNTHIYIYAFNSALLYFILMHLTFNLKKSILKIAYRNSCSFTYNYLK